LRAHWGGLLTAASGDIRCVRGDDGALQVNCCCVLCKFVGVCPRLCCET
jgi:hypothetical protein